MLSFFIIIINVQEALKYVEKYRSVRPQQSFVACIDKLNEKLQQLKESMLKANETFADDDEHTSQ